MWTLQFWQNWPRGSRIFFLIFSIVFIVAIAWMWVAFFVEPSPTINLQTIYEPKLDEIAVDRFVKGPFDFTVTGNNYVILQRELGSMLKTEPGVGYAYAAMLAIFVIGMLAVISTLGRFYYLVGMGIFILFVTSLSPEVLGLLGYYGKTFTLTVMAMYCLPAFWLFYFSPSASFGTRVLVFTVVTVVVGLIIHFFSATALPFLHIATYAAEAGLIVCGLFIVTVSHEIVAAFVFVVTQNTRTGKSLNHFLIITLIYLVNLALAYAVRFGFIKWDLVTINLYLLLTISGILGVWGIRQREKTYEGIIDANPHAVYAFLLTGAFAFATIGMFMLNANDTALSAIADVIIFAHIGFGVIFLTYIFSNFVGMLAENYAVHKVLYTPNNMPFFTFRFAGLIATLALVFYNTWQVPAHNAVSGYYNGIADLFNALENPRLAHTYYEESRSWGFLGHHSNYALANEEGAFDGTGGRDFYNNASTARPTPMSYLNWAQTYQSAGDNLTAITTLKKGIGVLKDHSSLENTLGLIYAETGLPDSALVYLDRSGASSKYAGIARSNKMALSALGRFPLQDSTAASDDAIMNVNRLALLNKAAQPVSGYSLPKDTVLTLADAAGMNNYILSSRNNIDTAFIGKVIGLARKPSNIGFKEPLLFASAISLYNSGETKRAFLLLEEVTVGSELQGKYNNILTMWALENNEPQRALGYADYAVSQRYEPARLTYAVALTEALTTPGNGGAQDAIVAWDSLRHGRDTTTARLAQRMFDVLRQSSVPDTDEDKYAYARYKLGAADSSRYFELAPTIRNDNTKAKILLDLAQKTYAMDDPRGALKGLQRIVGLELTDPAIGAQMTTLEMLARVKIGQAPEILSALKSNPVDFNGKEKKYKVYFDALAAQAAGDTTIANLCYKWLGDNPFFEDGLLAASGYFQKKGLTSYNMLAQALLYHPSSVRVRKAYALESARNGFEDYASEALDELRPMISVEDHADLTKQVKSIVSDLNNQEFHP
jgi:hypothetical protein